MQQPLKHIIRENTFWLSPDRVMYWEEEKSLIIADLHFGKTGHFRKSGIAIPQNIYKEDLQRLVSAVQNFKPQQLIITGDLFHSKANKELDLFLKWRNDLSSLKIHLVKGNHDILPDEWYEKAGFEVHQQKWEFQDFCFMHDPCDPDQRSKQTMTYSFTGHIHPAISLRGSARQSLRFPCFYFKKNYSILPAFGKFTGTHLITPEEGESAYAIAGNRIIQVA